jgi:putative membrane protein
VSLLDGLLGLGTAWAHSDGALVAPLTPPPSTGAVVYGPPPPLPPTFSWTQWETHISTVIGIVLLSALYLYSVTVLRRRYDWAPRTPWKHVTLFLSGMIVLFFSLNGPVHDLSDTFLFSAHMVQHLMLAQIIPPLWLAGCPDWLLRPLVRGRRGRAVARACTTIPGGFLLYSVIFSLWHIPLFYNLMMANHDVHIVMHLMVLVTATCMWWPVVGSLAELPRPSEPAQMLYMFLLGLPMMAVAALITLSPEVLYPWYAKAPRLWGLSPHDDQVLGGLIMWVPGAFAYWIAMTVVWFRWAGRDRSATVETPLAIPRAPALDPRS